MGSRYRIGQHGAKRREQRRLGNSHDTKVSGRTHESEHAIGFDVLKRTSNLKRGKCKKSRRLEKDAWAYQEQKQFHRDHIGTGSSGTPDESGFDADTYRECQRKSLEAGLVSDAIQINQLAYAFLPNFKEQPNTRARKAANDSYDEMVHNMDKVTYLQSTTLKSVEVTTEDKIEMYLSRIVAEGKGEGKGGWPSKAQIKDAKKKFRVLFA